MWTVTLKDAPLFANGEVVVLLAYSDGKAEVTQRLRAVNPPANWLADAARDRIADLEAAQAFLDALPGQGAEITPSVPIERDTETPYSKALRDLREQTQLVELGVAEAATLEPLKDAVKAAAGSK